MSHTLLLRLAGPMQSWGVSSRFSIRETLTEPSKSGVIGLLCAALGWDRNTDTHPIAGRECTLTELSALRFGVRVVREGVLRRDYHTAQNVLRAKVKLRPGKATPEGDLQKTVLSERYYLSDAYFLVGLEGNDLPFLQALDGALDMPFWPLSLGRKAFIPSLPVRLISPGISGIVAEPLTAALLSAQPDGHTITTRLVLDKPPCQADTDTLPDGFALVRTAHRTDVPVSFGRRQFLPRDVQIYANYKQPD